MSGFQTGKKRFQSKSKSKRQDCAVILDWIEPKLKEREALINSLQCCLVFINREKGIFAVGKDELPEDDN